MTDSTQAARSAPVNDEEDYQAPGEARHAIAPPDAGERVDAWLAKLWPDLSRSRVQGLIGAGKLSVDGALVTHAKDKPRPGARYELTLPPPEPAAPQPETLPLTIVYEDADLIVVDGDPLEDLSLLAADGAHVPLVMRAGEIVKSTLGSAA